MVRRVRGVPGRVLQNVALDHPGHDRRVVSETDHRRHPAVAAAEATQLREYLRLGHRGRQVKPAVADHCRHSGRGKGLQAGVAKLGEHRLTLIGVRTDMAVHEGDHLTGHRPGRVRGGLHGPRRACPGCSRRRRRGDRRQRDG